MNEQASQEQHFVVSIYEPEKAGGTFVFTFVPKGLPPGNGNGRIPRRRPQFAVAVRQESRGPTFDWSETPDDPGTAREEIEMEIAARLEDRSTWMERVAALVGQVEQWAREMDWSTRRVPKTLDDDWIGKHRVAALLMQEDTCRILLEPIGPSTPGTEGVVDLYLMPAYDDIARLYYYDNRWNIHHSFPDNRTAATVREAEALPLSKETLGKVLAELKQNAV